MSTEIEQRVQEPLPAEELLERRDESEKKWREWMMVGVGLTALLSLIAIIVSVVSLASSNSNTTTVIRQAPQSTRAAAHVPAAVPAKSFKMVLKPDSKKGSDGDTHDAFVSGTNLNVKAGQTVHVTVVNYDDMPHSFTSPLLAAGAPIPAGEQQMQGTKQDLKVMPAPGVGVDQTLAGATKKGPTTTTFTFTAPKQAGQYIWYCKLPCDAWAMAHIGYMRGYITVTA